MPVFDGVHYSLSPSLPPTRRDELASILALNGAVPLPPYTHLILLSASHAHNNAASDTSLKLVTDRWVDRSIVMGKRQLEQYYSPDPAMIFSGVVACATDLSVPDLEVLSAGITALGGQWRLGLTRDVTHLFALRAGSDKYKTALHFAPQTHMCIVTPHWFDDAVRLGRRIPETPYAWPDPAVLRPGVTIELNDDLTAGGKRKRKPADTDTEEGDGANISKGGESSRVWDGRRILLSTSLKLGNGSRIAIEAGIQRAGGVVVPITDDADEDSEEKAVEKCDVLVTRWRSGKSYFKAARASLLIGTLSWLFSVESSGTLHSPLDSLLWYPTPRGGIPDLVDCEISITNYTGAARDYLKRLIVLMGAKFTPSMCQSNKVLVAGFQPSPKTTRALSWSIPVVNHTWVEDCFVEWRALTVGLERYILYPPGIDFGKMLMTRHDGPPSSSSTSTSRLSGGAVPGGRGVGVIDVHREEIRDAEYRNRTNLDRHVQNTTGDAQTPTESRVRESSRAGSVGKTPLRPKGTSVFTPKTPTVTGRFVDHIIELPADDDEEPGGERHTPSNGKQRAGNSLADSHVAPQMSTPSSVVFSWPPSEAEMAPHDVNADSAHEEERDKRKGKERSVAKDSAIWSAWTVPEEENSRPPSRSSGLRPRPRAAQDKLTGQMSKPRRQAKEMTINSDLDLHPDVGDDEESDASIPPRRVIRTGSRTPVKSGMKTRPRSKSRPQSIPDDGNKSEVEIVETRTGTETEKGKRREEKRVVTKEKVTEKALGRRRSSTRSPSPAPPEAKNPPTQRRRLSVCVPPLPKDYFSSQGIHNRAEASDHEETRKMKDNPATTLAPKRKCLEVVALEYAVTAESSTSRGQLDKPSKKAPNTNTTENFNTQAKSELRSKPGVSKEKTKGHVQDKDTNVSEDERDGDESIVVEIPVASTSRGPRRSAANKATTKLREEVMPDVLSFEREQKQVKRRRSTGGESIVPMRGEEEEVQRVERNGKRRKAAEAEVEAEVEDVVLVSSHKPKAKQSNGKGKVKGMVATGSGKDMDDSPVKSKSRGEKGTRSQGTIRLMVTGVLLADDVIKRITRLGVQMTTKPTDCTHLIAKGIVRTEKFLCAMSILPYMLREEWANASAIAGKLLPEKDYLLVDEVAEKKWSFKFADAMERAKGPDGGSYLFKQMTFYVTPKVAVDTKLLKNVVSTGGGQVQTSTPTARILKGKANRYVVSCQEDKSIWRPLAQEGFKIYSPELILRGALRQEIEWDNEECMVTG